MARDRVVRDLAGQERQRRLQHGDVDHLALAGMGALEQRAGHAEGGGRAGQDVADRKARARRPGLGMAGDRHDAGQRLDLAVITRAQSFRPGLAKA